MPLQEREYPQRALLPFDSEPLTKQALQKTSFYFARSQNKRALGREFGLLACRCCSYGALSRLLRTSFRLLWGWEKLCGPAALRCSNRTTFNKTLLQPLFTIE
jgi:hypothetical protein